MHPILSQHYEEELASLVFAGKAVWIQKNHVYILIFQREYPHTANHFLTTVGPFNLQPLWIRSG